jgi:hypothetical protein
VGIMVEVPAIALKIAAVARRTSISSASARTT